jgi:hypothetical protein
MPDEVTIEVQRASVTIATSNAGTPASAVTAETTFGQASAVGVSTAYARGDHTHGTPALPTAEDVGADPEGTADDAVAAHDADGSAHADIRALIGGGGGGAVIARGPWADRDTEVPSPAEGTTYLSTDSPLVQRYVGGAWRAEWPGHGEVTPTVAADWTGASWGAGGTGSLANAHGGMVLTSLQSAGFYAASRSASNGQVHTIGWDWSSWSQAFLPSVLVGVEDTGGRSVLIGWSGDAATGAQRVVVSCYSAPGTYAGFGRVNQQWIGRVPPFVRLDTSGGLASFQVGPLSSAGPWTPLWEEALGGAFLGATIAAITIAALPGSALAATLSARPIRIPILHYAVT